MANIDAKCLAFFHYLLWDTLSLAAEIKNTTDTNIRKRISELETQEAEIQLKASEFIKENNLSRTKLRRKNKKDPQRSKYDMLIKQAAKCVKERDKLEEVLHARLVLKDPQGLVVWLASTGFFEKHNFDLCGDKALDILRRIYPD